MRNIKELEEGIEVIVLTGLNSIDNAVQALRHGGAFDFLSKPLENDDQLINSVEKALQKQKLQKSKGSTHLFLIVWPTKGG